VKILLIEDEPSVASFIKRGLEEQGHEVTQAFDGTSGLQVARQHIFELIILDLILPHLNGLDVCKSLREEGYTQVPILMLTALSTTDDVVIGLEAGADDYLTKPFKFKELLARVNALARRKQITPNQRNLQVADLKIDLNAKKVSRSGIHIQLTAREFALLEYFVRNKGRVVSRVDILEQVWDLNFDTGTNVIDVYVNYLRKKIDKNFSPKLIHTVIGMGYVLKES
jgi:two-component system copper resistance phosphate regulon response regulator CusR